MFFLLFGSLPLLATHDMGADLTYTCVGGNTYEFTLVFYRSCEDVTAAPADADLRISSETCGFTGAGAINITLPQVNAIEISPICPAELNQSQCADINNPHPGVEEYIYQGQVVLPANCEDWNISWFTCCRNANITNADINPNFVGGTRMRIEATLNNLDVGCHSSPTFSNIPTPFINAGQPYWYNNGAIDLEGDSIAYELVNPLENDNTVAPPASLPVTFLPGFSATNPVLTDPPNSFGFDPITGQMFFTPDGPQWDILAVRVKEYRDGLLIGSTMRDLQFVVRDNPLNQQPLFNPPSNVSGGSQEDYTFSVCAGGTLSFDIQVEDPNAGDVLTIANNLANQLPGATITTAGQNPLTISVNWPTTLADLGNHFLLMVVEDNGCPVFGRQSVSYRITVHEGVITTPPLITMCPGASNTVQLQARVNGGAGNGTYRWTPSTGLSNPNIPNPVATVTDTITYTVSYDEGGCITTDRVALRAEGEAVIQRADTTICLGDSVALPGSFLPTLPPQTPTCGLSANNCQGPTRDVQIGAGINSTAPAFNPNQVAGAGSPFHGFREDARTQVLIRANELAAAGLEAGLLTEIALQVADKFSSTPYQGFRIKMGCTNLNTLVAFQPNLQEVFEADVLTNLGLNVFTFDTPYEWDGVSNLLVEFCYNNPDGLTSGNDHVFYTLTPYNSVVFNANDESAGGEPGCELSTGGASTQRPNIRFGNCALNLPLAYSWSPAAGLSRTNVATPRASPSVSTTYTLTVTTPSCSYTDTVRVNVSQPPSLGSLPAQTLCQGDTLQLSVTGTDLGNATFAWNPGGSLSNPSVQNPLAFPTSTTNYLLTATNQCGNDVQTTTINVVDPPALTVDLQDISCFRADDGAIQVQATGAGGFQYRWTPNVGTSPSLGNLAAGTYQLNVTDLNGCETDTSLVITEPTPLTLSLTDVVDADCNGASTGEVTLAAQGGTPMYRYSRDGVNFLPDPVIDRLPAGAFTLYTQDQNGCEATVTANVAEPAPLDLQILDQVNVDCHDATTGSVTLAGSGGTAPYEYALGGGAFSPSNVFDNLGAGPYTASIRDANGCTYNIQVNITQPDPLAVAVSNQEDAQCFGTSTAALTVFSTGGSPAYRFSLDGTNYVASPNFTGLPAGDYTIFVRDGEGCEASTTTILREPPEITGQLIELEDVSCFGENNGQFTVQGNGGNPGGYLYSLDGVDFVAGGTFGGLEARTYQVTISDFSGCQGTLPVTIDQPQELLINLQAQTDVDCFGNASGEVTLAGSGGSPGYAFSRNGVDFQASPNFDALPAGGYTFTVQDANGCLRSLQAEVLEPAPLEGELVASTPVDCNGNSTGSVTLQGLGGIPGYAYALDGQAFLPGGTFDNLAAGSYQATIQDANGCTSPITFSVSQPSPVTPIVDAQIDVDCYGNSTGLLSVTGRGGTPGYQYALDGGTFSTNRSFANLPAATYTLSVQDANGCIQSVDAVINQPDSLQLVLDEERPVSCFGGSDARLSLQANGGVPTYAFALGNGPFERLGVFEGLSAQTYTLSVRDANNCQTTLSVEVEQPDSLQVLLAEQIDASCNGAADASLRLSGLGGTPDYVYSLNGNAFVQDPFFNNLQAGSYELTIQDARACQAVLEVDLSEPAPLVSLIDSLAPVDCYGNQTGEVWLTTAGGTGPYAYSLDLGANFAPQPAFANLAAGRYEVLVRDQNNCQTRVPISMPQPDSIQIDLNHLDISCFGEDDGQAIAFVEGGTPGYTYLWNNDPNLTEAQIEALAPGTYELVLTDANGCQQQAAATILEPAPLNLTADITNESCTEANGAAEVLVAGGTGAYTYAWNTAPVQTAATATGLSAGTYEVRVQDANNCEAALEVVLTDEEAPVLAIDTLINASCNGLADGSIAVLASMGTGNYAYAWDTPTPQATATATNLPAGTYELTVDDGRCVARISAEITQPDSLIATINDFQVPLCHDGSDGMAQVDVRGGTPGYRYEWNTPTPQLTSVAENLPAGTFTVQVLDGNDCQTEATVTLTAPTPLLVELETENISCAGGADGLARALVSGGTPPYQYRWSDGTTNALADSLPAGPYELMVLDFNNCEAAESLNLSEPAPLLLAEQHTDLSCFQANDGTVAVTPSGGVAPYQYQWAHGPSQPSLSGLASNTYELDVFDANDCVASIAIEVNQPDSIEILVDKEDAFCNEPNGQVRVEARGGTPGYLYIWNTGDMGPSLSNLLGEPLGGPYVVTVIDEQGCEQSLDVGLNNLPPAVARFSLNQDPSQPILLSRGEIQFVNQSENSLTYLWDFGDGTTSEQANPSHLYEEEGTYTVSLVAIDPNNACPADTSLALTFIVDGSIYIPNAFTPNGDGYNDLFRIGGEGVVSLQLTIFDRWGHVVRRLEGLEESWDGTNESGESVQEGVYTFVMKAQLNSGRIEDRGGTITLIR